MVGGGTSSKLRRAARKMLLQTCAGSFRNAASPSTTISSGSSPNNPPTRSPSENSGQGKISQIAAEEEEDSTTTLSANKNLCSICLDPLSYCSSPGQAIFTAQCTHSFHFTCISSNVRHGSVTCPICRAHWTQLPRTRLNMTPLNHRHKNDPVLRILDDSIANSRVHRRSILRSARYDDDDPIETDLDQARTRLDLTLLPTGTGAAAYLCVRQVDPPPTDLVLVASPNGPHLRLMKQAMALTVFLLRSVDRLAIVAHCSSAATRILPLRRMTVHGKRAALQVVDRLFYTGHTEEDPIEGLRKGVKILVDRVHENPQSCILHLSDAPTGSSSYRVETPVSIHRFHVGFGFGAVNGFVMHEFEEFLERVLGGVVRDVQLRIGGDSRVLRLGEIRGGEERRIPLNLGEFEQICVEFSYIDERIRRGEIVLSLGDGRERNEGLDDGVSVGGGRASSVGSWEYHDPYMARRWAKHLHGYRL